MNWNDYEALWKRQELPVGAHADATELRTSFEAKRRKLAANLLARDLLEISSGLLVSGAFAFTWWQIGREGWPLMFAIALILGVCAFFVRERFRARRLKLGADAPLLTKIEADSAELRHQRHLLLKLWSWYLAPLVGALVIASATLARIAIGKLPPNIGATLWAHPAALALVVLYFAVIVPLCFWGTWAVNRRVVRKQIEPRLDELEKLRRDLLAGG